jgi:hypothetical protein
MSDVQKIIVALNSIKVGDLDLIVEKLGVIRGELQAADLDDQAGILELALDALRGGRIPEFRKLMARATAELGHCKGRRGSKRD